MALLPAPKSQTVEAIYSWWTQRLDAPRAYLGGSVIGRECERQLWYSFRWATSGERFEGRMLRLFDRGQREEAVFVQELRGIGCQVHDVDPSTGQQFKFKAVAGHAGGSIDGVVLGLPEAPKTWHVLEAKTHNAKSFAALQKDGVAKAKPEHYAQMQVYMRWGQLTRALYLSVNKDTDELYAERVREDAQAQDALEAKAARVVYAAQPLPRLSDDAAFYKCKFCPAAQVCHGQALPAVSCRTCLHATPESDGDGRWSCALAPGVDLPLEVQRRGCPSHLYVPALLEKWGEAEDASPEEGWVQYKAADGYTFRNGPWGLASFTSKELAASTTALMRDEQFQAIRAQYAGVITDEQVAA